VAGELDDGDGAAVDEDGAEDAEIDLKKGMKKRNDRSARRARSWGVSSAADQVSKARRTTGVMVSRTRLRTSSSGSVRNAT
jgi:hypothetical protein